VRVSRRELISRRLEIGDVGRVLWKIDYYDKAMAYGSEEPSDPSRRSSGETIQRDETPTAFCGPIASSRCAR
jgi:hypothetical protein